MKTLYKMNNVCKRVSAMGKALALAVVMLAFGNSAYAWQIEQGDVYFDNTVTKWSKVYIRFGTSSWCTVYEMSKVADNDNIYYINFQGTADNIEAIQFASVDEYNVTDPSQCFDQCGIYNGNVIDGGQKTDYVRADLSGSNRCIVAIGNTGFCAYSGPQPMPSSVSYNLTTLGGSTVTKGGIVGYFTPSQKVSFAGSTTLSGYPEFPTGVGDYVHATFRYYLSGSTYSNISCAGSNTSTKSFSTQVTLPSVPGKYTMSTYYRCGGVSSETYTSYYHIVGLTGNDLNFGALQAGATKALSENLSNVWAGDGTTSVTAEISGAGASNFSFSEDASTQSTSIAITNKAGSADIYFTAPSEKGNYTATLTLTLTYNTSQTITKTYTLSGSVVPEDPTVMLGAAPVCLDGPRATLGGYLKLAACNNDIETAGIVWGTSDNPTIGGSGCTNIECITGDTPIEVGTAWSGNTAENFTAGTTYHYRAYVIDTNTGVPYYSPDGTFTCSSACVYPESNDTVYIQVDKNFDADDDCALKYRELQTAVTKIKSIGYLYNSTYKTLNKHIVVLVGYHKTPYTGTGTTSVTGGGATDLSTIIFEDINNTQTPAKVLVIRAANPAQSPIIQHPTIRNSKNITFENVNIHGSESAGATSTQFDNAVDIDSGDTGWMGLTIGAVANANINFRNCEIKSKGFTCLHAAAYDGITFENCDIKAELDPSMLDNANTNKWGASVKFIRCKNIKFLRNNFLGSHATSVWLQGVIGFLAMNNVFWNNNDAYNSSFSDNGTFFRLVTQNDGTSATDDLNQKIGIYYNTLYIAENEDVTADRHFDFFRLNSNYVSELLNKNLDRCDAETIRFLYNNCYSYDTSSVIGCNQSGDNKWCLNDTESRWCESIHHNNYWSMKEGMTPNFVIPNETACSGNVYYNVNVYEQVCSTAASDPATLVIKGGDLNLGQHITSDESGLGGENLYNDRLHASNGADAVRKTNGKWTIGAYQQSEASTPVDVIVWWGDVEGDGNNWDNRYNWRKFDGSRVTCVDNFASDLKVIIPAPESEVYKTPAGGIKNYPNLPAKFDGTRTKNTQETVNAGHGISIPSKFAGTIELEYGGAIKNVEALNDDEARRYAEVNTSFTAGRSEWILVGTVVKPFVDGSKQSVRLVQSGDYFIANHEPHVYMHEASFNASTAEAGWLTPFTQLDQEVPYDRVFAIKVPDQYGSGKLTASRYFKYIEPNESMLGDGIVPKTFNFNGWFLNDEIIPEYKIAGNIIMSNTYPATLSVEAAIGVNHGEFKVYDYSEQSFESGVDYIKPQNGFIFVPGSGNDGYFRITPEMLTSENTKYKSATATNPTLKLRASNPAGTDGSSSVLIIYDELKSDEYVQGPDLINTTIAGMPTKPEVYAMMFGKELDKATVPSLEQAIPLGLKLERAMTVEFTIPTMEGIEKAILEDREANKSYDLLKGEKGSISLAAGTYAGRFYLNLGAEEQQDVPTEGDDVTTSTATIDLYGNGKNIIISSSENVILKSAEITDMSGKTTVVDLKNPHFNKVNVKGAQGVYVVKAIGDTKTETAKVIVK